jgi:hypothetical protein
MTDVTGTPFERRFSNLPTNGSFFLPPKQMIRVRVWSSTYLNLFCGREKHCICCGAKMSTAQEKRREERDFFVINHSSYFFIECVFYCLLQIHEREELILSFFAFKILQTS